MVSDGPSALVRGSVHTAARPEFSEVTDRGANLRDGRPLGARRLIEDVQSHGQSHLIGAAIFGTPGTTMAVIAAINPMLPYPRRKVAAVNARTAEGGLPMVVALAVSADGVTVYPATTRGEIRGPAVTRWSVGDFRAATRRNLFVVRLVIMTRDEKRFELETKAFPVGPNRFNARIAQTIVRLGRDRGERAGPAHHGNS